MIAYNLIINIYNIYACMYVCLFSTIQVCLSNQFYLIQFQSY